MGRPDGSPIHRIVIACAPGDAATGARLLRALAEAGHGAVLHQRAPQLKSEKDVFDAAEPLVLVWSRHAAVDAGLLREAAAAAARGQLVLARLDATRPPPALRAARDVALSLARPQRGTAALLALLAAPARNTAPPARKVRTMNAAQPTPDGRDESSTWRGTLLLLVLIAGVAWSAYFVAFGKPPLDVTAFIAGLRA